MIPVNIVKISFDAEIRAVAIQSHIRQRGRFCEPASTDAANGTPPVPMILGA